MNPTYTRVAWATAACTLLAAPLSGQNQSGFIVAGYGGTTYEGVTDGPYRNDFSASFSPVLIYSRGPDFLFEAELEFGLSGDATTTTLEYAQIDYLGFENVQLIAGKFLVPFGVFGERLHPTWINKLPTAPILFGHAHGGVPEGALLPILADAGFMLRWIQSLGTAWALDFSGYATQGPRVAEPEGDGHTHGGEPDPVSLIAPQVALGVSFGDNNKNKMLGGRLGLVNGGGFEFYASGFHSMYDDGDYLDYYAAAVSAEWRKAGLELRGEAARVWQEFQEAGSYDTLIRSGHYLQGSYRIGSWEPVVRWGRLYAAEVDAGTVQDGHNEVALGFVYWFNPTLPMKVAWEYHQNRTDEFAVQWAFGF
jgi:hypothetical protein